MQIQKHEILLGQYTESSLFNSKEIGYSFLRGEDDFYTVKLNMFPVNSYFLAKNTSNENYTIYSKILRGDDGVKFKSPVGFAKLLPDNNSLMFMRFHMPRMSMYMDLFAKK